jgi:hypothetical protein
MLPNGCAKYLSNYFEKLYQETLRVSAKIPEITNFKQRITAVFMKRQPINHIDYQFDSTAMHPCGKSSQFFNNAVF